MNDNAPTPLPSLDHPSQTLPIDWIVLAAGKATWVPLFRITKLLRMFDLSRLLYVFSDFFEKKEILINTGYQRMIRFFFNMACLGHILGSFYLGLAYLEAKFGDSNTWAQGDSLWTLQSANGTHTVVFTSPAEARYIRAVYWAVITTITTGFGDIVANTIPESIYTIFTMYIGAFMTCMVIGNLTTLVASLDSALAEFQQRLDQLTKYMEYRKLPNDLRLRLRFYYEYMWSLLKGVDEEKFLRDLPRPLRVQVTGLMTKELVKKVQLFRKFSLPLINAISVDLDQKVYSPGDFVYRQRENPK